MIGLFHNLLTIFAVPPSGCADNTFLGLRPWYYYLPSSSFNTLPRDGSTKPDCSIINFTLVKAGKDSDVPLVLLAIVDDLLRIAGIVAVAFIIIGAIKFITSQGNPEDTAHARGTVINALVGLIIAIIAVAFVSFLGNELGK